MRSFEILDALTDMDDELLRRAEMSPPKRRNCTGKRVNLRLFGKIVAIAAVLTSLMITVYAADTAFGGGELFGGFFGGSLSEKQVEVLNTIGRTYAEENYTDYTEKENTEKDVLTSNGATITPISAASDGRICYLHFRLEAPEGVVLPDLPEDRYYAFAGKGSDERLEVHFYAESFQLYGSDVAALPDADPTDNVKEFVLELRAYWLQGFNGNTVRISIPGVWVKGLSSTSSKYHYSKLFSTEFEFDITVNPVDVRIDMRNVGVSHYNEQYDFTLNLERLIITPLRMEIYYTSTLPEDENVLPDGGVATLVMKDGTRLVFGDQSEVSDGVDVGYKLLNKILENSGIPPEDVAREANLDATDRFIFTEPVVLEDIDYIVWCGGKVIDVN